MSNTIVILSKPETLKKISSLKGRSATMHADIQAAVIGGLAHCAEHGDSTLLTKLVNAVSAANGTQLRKFITGHAPLVWTAGKFVKSKKGGTFNVAGALDADWNTYAKSVAARPVEYSVDKVTAKVKRALEAAMEAALDADDIITANQLAAAYQHVELTRMAAEERAAA